MNTVTLGISSLDEAKHRLAAAFGGEPQGQRISFATVDLLWRVISPERWAIIRAMTGQGPLTMGEVAQRVGRDVEPVQGDVVVLVNAGVVDCTEEKIVFPYDAVHVDFMLTPEVAAAA